MKFWAVLASDWIKIRKRGLWLLAVLGPVGTVAMQALNYGLRYDYLLKLYEEDLWTGLLDSVMMFVPISLYLGITLICSLLAGIEHQTNSWKQLLALPIGRFPVYASKLTVAFALLLFSCVLLALLTIVLGLLLGFGADAIPYAGILKLSFLPFLGSLPGLAVLLWFCLTVKNQGLPITFGVVCAVFALVPKFDWLPVNWPGFAYFHPQSGWFATAGLAAGVVLFAMGALHFGRKDVE
ncbi:ABC transporter permease [Paenibacillus sp. NPDC058071]|uniref:ABC transporter permease n=1 Tax=Paenibacillus sp. NPDC058071 TaxID=3346326 RepID=UPI0036DB0BE4